MLEGMCEGEALYLLVLEQFAGLDVGLELVRYF